MCPTAFITYRLTADAPCLLLVALQAVHFPCSPWVQHNLSCEHCTLSSRLHALSHLSSNRSSSSRGK